MKSGLDRPSLLRRIGDVRRLLDQMASLEDRDEKFLGMLLTCFVRYAAVTQILKVPGEQQLSSVIWILGAAGEALPSSGGPVKLGRKLQCLSIEQFKNIQILRDLVRAILDSTKKELDEARLAPHRFSREKILMDRLVDFGVMSRLLAPDTGSQKKMMDLVVGITGTEIAAGWLTRNEIQIR